MFHLQRAVARVTGKAWRTAAILAASLAAAGGLAFAAAGPAGATTLTCTNIAGAVVPGTPAGCGGLQSAWTGKGTLDIAADGNYNNAVVRVQLDSLGNSNEDFTAYAVGGSQTGSIGGLGRYVAMFTPDGKFQFSTASPAGPFTTGVPAPGATFYAGPNAHCISVVSENNGPKGAARWNVVLRNCNSNGVFKYGTGLAPGSVTAGFGNAWQEWAPVAQGNNLELVNTWLFNHHNVQYSLNVTGFGGAGTHLIAYPNDTPSSNEQWTLIGCTSPATTLSGGSYSFCP